MPMSNVVVQFENVWKKYRLGEFSAATLQEELALYWSGLKRNRNIATGIRPATTKSKEEFWALKDLNLKINEGEIHGIIGSNGAGKSTLLKILSHITTPTKGVVKIKGSISSLLEVGTGFHPDLTGRENIYLNGAIMGMSKKETRTRLDEIVDFSGCSKFIDTPVKRYSSGMLVRLGFSVAAHLKSDILVVDEVLAVGDQDFQNRCIDQLKSSAENDGTTIIFVSHNLSSVRSLCTRGTIMKDGTATTFNTIHEAIREYSVNTNETALHRRFQPSEDKPVITLVSVDGEKLREGCLAVTIEYESPIPIHPMPGVSLYSENLDSIMASNGRTQNITPAGTMMTSGRFVCEWERLPLHSGAYYLSAWLDDLSGSLDAQEMVIKFDFHPVVGLLTKPQNQHFGYLNMLPNWDCKIIS